VSIQAIFVRQIAIDVEIINPEIGEVVFEITQPGQRPFTESILREFYDEGTLVTISLRPDAGAEIGDINGIYSGELNQAGNRISIVLDQARMNISIEFVHRAHRITVTARSTAGWSLDGQITINSSIGNTIIVGTPIETLNVDYDSERFEFYRWGTIVQGEFRPLDQNLLDQANPHILNGLVFDADFVAAYTHGLETTIVAEFVVLNSVTIQRTGQGTFTANVVTFDGTNWNDVSGTQFTDFGSHTFEENSFFRIRPQAGQFYSFANIGGFTSEDINLGDGYFVIAATGARTIVMNFEPNVVTLNFTEDMSNGTIDLSAKTVRAGQSVTITVTPNTLFQRTSFTINGQAVEIQGNVATFQVTQEWLIANTENGVTQFNVAAGTAINRVFMFGMIALAVIVPLLLVAIILIAMSNAKKKREHAAILRRREAGAVRMNQADAIKKAMEGGKKA